MNPPKTHTYTHTHTHTHVTVSADMSVCLPQPPAMYLLLCFIAVNQRRQRFHMDTQQADSDPDATWTKAVSSFGGGGAHSLNLRSVCLTKCQGIKRLHQTHLSVFWFPPLQLPDPDWKRTETDRWDADTDTLKSGHSHFSLSLYDCLF